ncbi:hypothetical protein EIN_251380 [Entamoeba invadens IP1]|uniref:Uncharacterized protein n=1 Tax=Entamoeba invadens IP1 TaxID=370355 RepID=A0A0A1UGL2_ENTIV|nr:hypothetical protein EIN_251380 [Entamoeba invadens IP1]ELP94984.1 hypothetical protein EIN_251380 [Entamoeba invadens IP1]|eukprot:XP_004261755.1 hypothetical protein EIN_251380 [Entamoeba invadens IP1]
MILLCLLTISTAYNFCEQPDEHDTVSKTDVNTLTEETTHQESEHFLVPVQSQILDVSINRITEEMQTDLKIIKEYGLFWPQILNIAINRFRRFGPLKNEPVIGLLEFILKEYEEMFAIFDLFTEQNGYKNEQIEQLSQLILSYFNKDAPNNYQWKYIQHLLETMQKVNNALIKGKYKAILRIELQLPSTLFKAFLNFLERVAAIQHTNEIAHLKEAIKLFEFFSIEVLKVAQEAKEKYNVDEEKLHKLFTRINLSERERRKVIIPPEKLRRREARKAEILNKQTQKRSDEQTNI